jgi:hypothetical protein
MLSIIKKIHNGQSLQRILMNQGFSRCILRGRVVDVGGGRSPDYFAYFKSEEVTSIESVDASSSKIDFEEDALPYSDGSVDTVILANVLEHIYNYDFLLTQIHRILVQQGMLVGFVPFFIQYHPDPHDYFRYTKESLNRIFAEAGFGDVTVTSIGGGPFLVNYNTLMLSLPRIVRVILYPAYYGMDSLFLWLRPKAQERYPLGFIFEVKKM